MNAFKAKMIYVNDQIKAPSVMIIDDEKNNLWTFPRRIALEMAQERGLDLVQLTYDPEKMLSTVRMTDYGKYMYQKGKEEKERRKTQKGKDTKELKVSYSIGDNDLQLKIKKAQEILQDGDNVKFSIRFQKKRQTDIVLFYLVNRLDSWLRNLNRILEHLKGLRLPRKIKCCLVSSVIIIFWPIKERIIKNSDMEKRLLVLLRRCWKIYFLINKIDNGKSNEWIAETEET